MSTDTRSRDLCLLVNILRQLLEEDDARRREENRRHLAHARSHLDRDVATGRLVRAVNRPCERESPGTVSAARGMTSSLNRRPPVDPSVPTPDDQVNP